MASMFKTCLVPKSSIPAIPYINGRHLVNVLVPNIGSSKLSLQPLNIQVKNKENQWRVLCNSVGFTVGYPTSVDITCLVNKFINGIRSEDEDSLIKFLSDDWELHDDVFNSPSGTKDAKDQFLTKAKDAIKKNDKEFLTQAKKAIRADIPANIFLKIKSMSVEGLTAKVHWHLVWRDEEEEEEVIEIPFTGGCHVFECVKVGQNLLIRKITRVAEPDPSEPDQSVLKLVEAAVYYFYNFPKNSKNVLSRIETYINHPELSELIN